MDIHWITDSQDEQSIEELLRDVDQLHIPVFQRAYVWKQKQFAELVEDIELIEAGIESTQFLGAIVGYEIPRLNQIVGRLRCIAVVDGQQRLLTLSIFVMAITELLATLDKIEAVEVAQQYLLLQHRRGLEINTRLVPAFEDRSQFRIIWDRLMTPRLLQNEFGTNPPTPPPPSGEPDGNLLKQYNRIIRYLRKGLSEYSEEETKLNYLRNKLRVVTQNLTFVHLKLFDAASATKIFERLNFRGVRVGIIDLVRNEIFSGVANDPTKAKKIFEHIWRPFVDKFADRAEQFFFPYCLIQNSNAKKSELFAQLRLTWNGLTPEEIVRHMEPFQRAFISIDKTGILESEENISLRLSRLLRMKRPTTTYPYLIQLLDAFQNEKISEEQAIDLLNALESFLVRRAILGIEPSGLHALFKGLWQQMAEYNADEFITLVSEKPTIHWPNDRELKEAINTRALAKAGICNYLLTEYDYSLPGDNPSDSPTIEHILPQTYSKAWAHKFSTEEHKQLVDTWANLIPLSKPLNSSLQAKAFDIKRDRYKQESMFSSPRFISKEWSDWTPESIEERSSLLAAWATKRWPHSF